MRTASLVPSLFFASLALPACGPSSATSGGGDGGAPADLAWVSPDPLIRARPYESWAPAAYDPAKAWPLVVLLHGYEASPYFIDALFGWSKEVDALGFLYAVPPATLNASGMSDWNQDDDPTRADDVAYLDAVIADMSAEYHVDPKRIYVSGHSNGAAMTYRYACARADKLAAIVPVAGTWTTDPTKCAPAAPLSLTHVVGDMDPGYPGNPPQRNSPVYFAQVDGCQATTTTLPNIDIDYQQPGAETSIEQWPGCTRGTDVEMWTIHGALHHPAFSPAWGEHAIGWMLAHPKP